MTRCGKCAGTIDVNEAPKYCRSGCYVDGFGNCRTCGFNPCRCSDSDGNYEWTVIQDKRRFRTHLSDVEFMKNKIAEAAFGSNISGDFRRGALLLADWAIAATNSFDDAVKHCLQHQDKLKK